MIAGTETMSWREKYVGWYRIVEQALGKLVPMLTDSEIMENVTSEDQLLVPTGQEHLPRNKQKPLPKISLRLNDTNIELGILFNSQEQLKLFKNIFRNTHAEDREKLLRSMQSLDSSYETLLYSKTKEEKLELIRKYVTTRLDAELIERIIDELENLRRGGRQIQNNQSFYLSPKIPELYLTRISVPLTEIEFKEVLENIRPVYAIVMSIKTQREIISDRLSKPKIKRNMYREFIESLNLARKQDLITAEKRRELNKKWRENEEERKNLMEQLRDLLNPKKIP
jgi:hypothetical protein